MNTYAIGDIHGCYDQLQTLLNKVAFDATKDHLICVGDLVNRGPQSLETLRFLRSLPNVTVTLGNHDLYLIALFYGAIKRPHQHYLHQVIEAKDSEDLIHWLIQKPFLHHNKKDKSVIVHAGIPPQWTIQQAQEYATEVHMALTQNTQQFLTHMYGNLPDQWHEDLPQWDRLRYITNALTRMRFCQQNGTLNLNDHAITSKHPSDKPWFEWYQHNTTILFGHWAALRGQSTNPKCIALDTGCVWGETLTAYHLETQTLVSVPGAVPQP